MNLKGETECTVYMLYIKNIRVNSLGSYNKMLFYEGYLVTVSIIQNISIYPISDNILKKHEINSRVKLS